MATYLVKTEPSEFSFQMLSKLSASRWDGVRNNTALIHVRTMRCGDTVYIYHTGDEKAIVGIARVVRDPYPDPAEDTAAVTAKGELRFPVVDLQAIGPVKSILTLAMMKADDRFADFDLLKQSRLSVMPVPSDINAIIQRLTR